jgi:hypothetical protein
MDETKKLTPDGWIEDLDASEAELARGETVPYSVVKQMLRDSIEQLEAKQMPARPKRKLATGGK